MAKRKKLKKTYSYECTLTGKKYAVGKQATNPEELVSVAGFYQLHPELDDRPEQVKVALEGQGPSEQSDSQEDTQEN